MSHPTSNLSSSELRNRSFFTQGLTRSLEFVSSLRAYGSPTDGRELSLNRSFLTAKPAAIEYYLYINSSLEMDRPSFLSVTNWLLECFFRNFGCSSWLAPRVDIWLVIPKAVFFSSKSTMLFRVKYIYPFWLNDSSTFSPPPYNLNL